MGRFENNQSPPCELIPSAVIVSDFENEAENVFVENDGYQLLSDNDIQEPLDMDSAITFETETTQTDDDNTNTFNETNTFKSDKTNDTPRDIVVDYEQVRAAMSGITLPTSAIPAWAAEVSDAELGSFLRNRITSLQQGNSSPNESHQP